MADKQKVLIVFAPGDISFKGLRLYADKIDFSFDILKPDYPLRLAEQQVCQHLMERQYDLVVLPEVVEELIYAVRAQHLGKVAYFNDDGSRGRIGISDLLTDPRGINKGFLEEISSRLN